VQSLANPNGNQQPRGNKKKGCNNRKGGKNGNKPKDNNNNEKTSNNVGEGNRERRVAVLIHTWVIVEETFNPLGVSLGASHESRCCHLILNSSV
jgi:hypothetical protein